MRLTTILFIAAILLAPSVSQADVPQFMSYQGVLKDAAGDPVSDGFYDVDFYLYDVATGGTALWTEPHGLYATGGIIEAKLGSIVPFEPLPFDVPYWLGIRVDGEPELSPRTALATVPYAGYAATARECIEGDEDWTVAGSNIYHEFGNVGIGTATPDVALDVFTGNEACARFENNASNEDFTVRVFNNGGTAGGFFSGTSPTSSPLGGGAAVYGVGGPLSRGGQFSSEGSDALFAVSANGRALWGRSSGDYAGYFDGGGLGVYVEDQFETNAFRMAPGGANGYVLTSDVDGIGSWQAPAALADGDWTIAGSDMYSTVSGEVGIGTTSPAGKLDISTNSSPPALNVTHGAASVIYVIDVERTSTHNSGNDLVELSIPSGSSDTSQFIECDRGGSNVFAVNGNGYVDAAAGAEFGGSISADDYADVVGLFTSSAPSNHVKVVSGIATATGDLGATGVYGESVPADGAGVGCKGLGGNIGVRGEVWPTGSDHYYGVYGYVSGGSGTSYGLRGHATSGSFCYGVYGSATGGATNYAGYFSGSAHVTGTFTAGTKSFLIDHPLDPENKYLQHACVESDDMMNIYNGNIVLDGRGEAWVEMPDWFEALNQDFRYQLTPVGAPGPNLYIAEEVSGGRFMIAGGEPGAKISWQVTGVRHDAVALANRMSVERDKPSHEAGKYLNPEAYGKPATMAVHYHEEPVAPSKPGEALARMQRSERSRQEDDDGE